MTAAIDRLAPGAACPGPAVVAAGSVYAWLAHHAPHGDLEEEPGGRGAPRVLRCACGAAWTCIDVGGLQHAPARCGAAAVAPDLSPRPAPGPGHDHAGDRPAARVRVRRRRCP
jgi:hypothetical protein